MFDIRDLLAKISISTDNNIAMAPYDFDNPIFHTDEECEEDCKHPKELVQQLWKESKVI